MKAKIVNDDSGDTLLTIPEPLIASEQFLPDDDIATQVKGDIIYFKNLSCPTLRPSRFRRNLSSIIRNMNNENHPLKRVLIKRKNTLLVCLPHDKFSSLNEH